MSFTTDQKVKLVKILEKNMIQLEVQLDAFQRHITTEIEMEVIAQIARWEAGAGTGQVWFTATESNEGFNKSAPATGGDPKTNIEILLFFCEDEFSSPYQVGLERG